jgi:Protein of unknown function (DUF1592)/Protein of unknown function (DUF1588)/Protein of unknown function (DUF1595)/Protein of unknown function (DUF1585)/Protein of unknown function (DUF1587)
MNDRTKFGALAGVFAVACSNGSIYGGDSEESPRTGGSGQAFATAPPVQIARETRIVRLSQAQYSNTLQDLFGDSEISSMAFAPDALNGFKFDTSSDLRVDPRSGPEYRNSAENVAERAVADSAIFSRIVGCNAADTGCANQFIQSFGQRAFRRPLSDAEVGRFRGLFDQAGELGDGDAFHDGVQLVVEAMLQSPQFLYRAEVSQGQLQNGRMSVDDWEVASRLSYFLYDSMPDATLFERARAGQLRTEEQIATQVTRMLGDARVTSKFVSFHEQVWQFGRYAKIAPDAATFRNLPSNFVDRLLSTSDAFLSDVIDDGGGLEEFLTAPYAFADGPLGSIYGQTVSGDTPRRIDFQGGERKGFLMQLGFLTSNSYAIKTDPIHRGLFILRDVLCRAIPDPPPGAATTPPPKATTPIVTTRDEVSLLTGQQYCPTCHGQINEPGFSFEGFDAIGRVREQENGEDVDTTGSISLDGEKIPFDDAADLVEALAQSDEARNCYIARWLEFANGRELATVDVALRDRLAQQPMSVKELVTTLATSPEFRSRVEAGQ